MREKVWNLEKNIFFPGVMSSIHLIFDLYTAFKAKQTAGYQVSIVDLYAIALGRHLNVDAHGVGYGKLSLFSSIKETWSFKEHSVPFPIILALGREEEEVGVNLNSSIVSCKFFFFLSLRMLDFDCICWSLLVWVFAVRVRDVVEGYSRWSVYTDRILGYVNVEWDSDE